MAIVVCIVICDECGKWIDARTNSYFRHPYFEKDYCESCQSKMNNEEQLSLDEIGGYNGR